MFLSLNWLKDFVDIPKSLSPEELGLKLTLHTVEVDGVEKQADKFANIVVGKILEIKKHPNADRLQIVVVDAGAGKSLDIVCGASNIQVGQLVPLALAGAVLPNGVEIKEAEVRGVKSFGMLCAEDELGLGEDHSGIMILDGGAKIGQNLAEYLKLKDVIYDIDNKSLTNRPDLWSHYGMAREIAAFLDVKLKEYTHPNLQMIFKSTKDANTRIDVNIEDKKLCPRYMAIAISGIKVEPSPEWMRERLIAAGRGPINNIVDITNYVMLEFGQPLHAFDINQIAANNKINSRELKIIVRKAKKGEFIETLDGEKRRLDKEMLVIAGDKGPLAIAGVMGGAGSAISDETNLIILECANFEPVSIRKTSQKLGLRTESSIRFEKSLDPNLCETALARAVELLKKICPSAEISGNLVDEKNFKLNQGPIKLDLKWLDKIIGEKISEKQVVKILSDLGFGVKLKNNNLEILIPSWRAAKDASMPEDIVEEIARIYGYDKLTSVMPAVKMQAPINMPEKIFERKVKNILAGAPALAEVYNYSFVGEEQLKKLMLDYSGHIKLANPISSQHALLRKSLAPNLINNIKLNQSRYGEIGIFEIGSIFLPVSGDINKDKTNEKLPYQAKFLGIAVAGKTAEKAFSKIKGIAEHLVNALGLCLSFLPVSIVPGWADEKNSASINILKNNKAINIGMVCGLNNAIKNNVNIKKEVFIAEINFTELFNVYNGAEAKKYQEYDKYPPVIRDLAFVVNEKILYNDIRDEIAGFSELVNKVELFDVYSGGKLGKQKKNLAFHIAYLAPDRTLTSEEVDGLQKRLIKHLEEKFEAKVRDF